MPNLRLLGMIAFLTVLLGHPGAAQTPSTRKDFLGDPLPPGALTRLRHAGAIGLLAFTPDLAFSPGSATLAAAHLMEIGLWDLPSGKKLRSYRGHENGIMALAFAPDGKRLASASADGTIRLWGDSSDKELGQIAGAGLTDLGWVAVGLAFAPDGKTLAATAGGDRVGLWDVATLKEIRRFPEMSGAISAAAFSPDGAAVAGGCGNGMIGVWDAATGKERPPTASFGRMHAVSFLDRGRAVAVVTDDKSLWHADADTGRVTAHFSYRKDGAAIAAVSADCRWLAVAESPDPKGRVTLRLRDGRTGRAERGLDQEASVLHAVFSPDGRTLAATTDDQQLRLWKVATGKPLQQLARPPRLDLPIAPTRVWLNRTDKNPRVPEQIYELAFSPDGRTLAGVDGVSVVHLWETLSGKPRGRFPIRPAGGAVLVLSPNGRHLGTCGGDGVIRLWDVASGQLARTLLNHHGKIHALAFAPDGKRLASAGADGTVRFWDIAGGEEVCRFVGHRGAVLSLAFSDDSRRLLSGGADTTALIWDLTDLSWIKKPRPPAPRLEGLWADLRNADATVAFQAAARLAEIPGATVPFLRERLKPVPAVPPERLARLLEDLGSPRYQVRHQAALALEKLEDQAEAALRKVRAGRPSPDLARRLEQLLEKLEAPAPSSAERLRELRAVEVLERIGTPEARQVMRALAQGAAGARLTREAQAALRRLQ